jgi:succinyl-CoA synthetase beta subunit
VKLQEHHARSLLARAGLPVPPWSVASDPNEAGTQAQAFLTGGADGVVIKAQVLVGGRGKAGGVKLARSAAEAAEAARAILGLDIKGITVRRVLVAPAADIVRELYLAAVLDRTSRRVILMGSAQGGVDIEELAASEPGAITTIAAHPLLGLQAHRARRMAFALGLDAHLKEAVAICEGLYRVLHDSDADLVEVNPLAIVRERTIDGPIERLALLDAKITVDDSALGRHPDIEAMRDLDEEDPVDVEARAAGLSFIRLDGDIGCMVNGAGLAMATMDLVKRAGGRPANFLDIGGGARHEKVAEALRLILGDRSVKAVLVNIFGGIARGDEVAHGLLEARALQDRDVPMVVRIVGTNAELAAKILGEGGEGIETAITLDDAVERAVALAGRAVSSAA